MFVHSSSTRKATGTAIPLARRNGPVTDRQEEKGGDHGWIASAVVFLGALVVAMLVMGSGHPTASADDPLTLPQQMRPMIIVPLPH